MRLKQLKLFACACLAALLGAGPAMANIEWSERYYNPAPAADDLVLPMPCGGAMVFRPVETPHADGTVGDVRVTLGQEGSPAPYLNGLRRAYVAGSFEASGSVPKGLFYMAKYEVAQAQWDVVMNADCPESAPRRRAFVPVVSVSALEALAFAETYTLWLMTEAKDSLPKDNDRIGYVRLPSEAEWEFAARGGLAVSDVHFRAPRPPMADGADPSEYIAHGGTESANGRVQAIGTLQPNPLGLHDMLGNAAELVETRFALVRHGRLHGQSGGMVQRGGDARTSLGSITSATRFEQPPFDLISMTATRERFTGLRLAIGGLAITSSEQTERMVEDLDRLAQPQESGRASAQDVDEVLTFLQDQLDTPQSLSQLEVVRETIAASRANSNALTDRSIRLLMQSSMHICDQVVGRLRNAEVVTSILQDYDLYERDARATGNTAMLDELAVARPEAETKLFEIKANLSRDLEDFGEIIEGLSDDYALSHLIRQSTFIKPAIEADGARRAACHSCFEGSLAARSGAGYVDLPNVEACLRDIALREIEQDSAP